MLLALSLPAEARERRAPSQTARPLPSKPKQVERVLRKAYPGKAIFKDGDKRTEMVVEVDPTRRHRGFSRAVAAIWDSAPHLHRRGVEVYKVLSGTLEVTVDGRKRRLKAGQSLRIGAGKVHSARSLGREPALVEAFSRPGWRFDDHLQPPAKTRKTPARKADKKRDTLYGLGAAAYTETVDQWALFRAALGDEKQRHGADLKKRLRELKTSLGKKKLRLLDVGAADGELTSYYAKMAKPLFALEISDKLMNALGQRPELSHATRVVADIQDVVGKGKDAKAFAKQVGAGLDGIVMSNMLFAVKDQVAVVDGAARLLAKGGKIFIIVTDDDCEFQRFRREYVKRSGLNAASNFPHHDLIAGLKKLGHKISVRKSPGTFEASVKNMMAMAPIFADSSPEKLAQRPEAVETLKRLVDQKAGADGRVRLENGTVLIELER